MKDYCCQIISSSGRVLEIFFDDYLDAIREATNSVYLQQAKQAHVFKYPDMNNIIGSARTIK